jgi:ankyrin repeat protein
VASAFSNDQLQTTNELTTTNHQLLASGSGLGEPRAILVGDPQQLSCPGPKTWCNRVFKFFRGHGYTALHMAAFTGAASIVKLLVDGGASVEARNRLGETP